MGARGWDASVSVEWESDGVVGRERERRLTNLDRSCN